VNAARRALIFGVSGQDGAYLAQLLLNKGYEVFGTSRDARCSSFLNLTHLGIRDRVQVESVAINDFRSVLQIIAKVRPDELYNLAGQSSVGLSFQQPVETFEGISVGTLNILESIRFTRLPVRFFNAGSSECFGDTGGAAADETTPFRPRSPYAVAKAAAFWEVENYRASYGLYACTGILFNHESPLRPDRFVTKKIVKAACAIAAGRAEKLRLGNTSISRDWGWAPEYVEAMWRMLQQDRPEDYVIATGTSHSLEEFIAEAFRCVELDWRDHVVADPSLYRPLEIHIARGDSSKALRQLGWKGTYQMKDVVRMMAECEQKESRIKCTVHDDRSPEC
jgi:GDPmannose 4,6-dehydratase